jgi:hypothetical protein
VKPRKRKIGQVTWTAAWLADQILSTNPNKAEYGSENDPGRCTA